MAPFSRGWVLIDSVDAGDVSGCWWQRAVGAVGHAAAHEPGAQGDVRAVGQEGDEDVRLDAVLELMVDRPGERVKRTIFLLASGAFGEESHFAATGYCFGADTFLVSIPKRTALLLRRP
jgi:hypothetical protein